MSAVIRFARLSDAEHLLQIYAQYIDTGITFEYALPDVGAFRQRMADTMAAYPYLVLETNKGIEGYAYAHRYRQREAYQWSAELSIYLCKEAAGRGLGKPLYEALMQLLRLQGVRTVYALVTGANLGSVRFHERLGFHSLGLHAKAGYKGGQWLDVHWFDLHIGDCESPPEPFMPLRETSLRDIRRIIRLANARGGYDINNAENEKEQDNDQIQ